MFPLEAKSKLPMNCTELMFQIKTKRKRRKKKKNPQLLSTVL